MGAMIELKTADGFTFDAWHVTSSTARKGGIVLLHEIFGLNDDIRRTADDFAGLGYDVVAPSLYDRVERGFARNDHSRDSLMAAIPLARQTDLMHSMHEVQACVDALKTGGAVHAIGFGYGGSAAWIAAAKVSQVAAVSCYYGTQLAELSDLEPGCPVIAHFGAADNFVPMEAVDRFKAKQPGVGVHLYEAGHGFFTKGGMSFDQVARDLSLERTLAVFQAASAPRSSNISLEIPRR